MSVRSKIFIHISQFPVIQQTSILEHVVCYFVLINKGTSFILLHIYLLNQIHCQLKQYHRRILNLNRSPIKSDFQFSVISSRLEVVSNLMTLYDLDDFLNMPPVKRGRRGASDVDEGDEEYRRKRERNNEAVKKSRVKSKQQTQDTFQRVKKLKEENQELEDTTKRLTKELELLKELFIATAANKADPKFEGLDLEKLLADTPEKKY